MHEFLSLPLAVYSSFLCYITSIFLIRFFTCFSLSLSLCWLSPGTKADEPVNKRLPSSVIKWKKIAAIKRNKTCVRIKC